MTHCSECGHRLEIRDATRRFCSNCQQIRYRNPAVGVAVLVVQATEVLLARRARGLYAGRWCVPCGYVEWDEDVRSAALRELREETGLDAQLGPVFDVQSNFHDPERHSVGIWFLAHAWHGQVTPGDDVNEVRFFPLDALPELAFATDGIVLSKLAAFLSSKTADRATSR